MGFGFVYLAISLALQYVLWYINKDGEKKKNKPSSKDMYSAPTAEETRPVPKFWGEIKLNSPNVVNWNITGQKRIKIKTKSLFGTSTQETESFKTYVDMHLALALTDGQDGADLISIYVNDNILFTNNTRGDFTAYIDQPEFISELEGYTGNIEFMSGKDGQGINSYLNTNLYNGYASSWKKLAHLVFKNFWITNGTSIAQMSMVLRHLPIPYWTNSFYSIIDNRKLNPAAVIYFMITDNFAGGSISPTRLNIQSFQNAAIKLKEENFGIALIRQEQSTVLDDISDILECIDGQIFSDLNTGLMTLTLNRQDYVFSELQIINEDNISNYSSSRNSLTSQISEVKIQYTDIDDNYVSKYAIFKNEATRMNKLKGETKIIQYDMICDAATANRVATREAIPLSCSLISLELETDRSISDKTVGDVIRVQLPKLNIDAAFRILEINYAKLKSSKIKVKLIQDRFGILDSVFSNVSPNAPIDRSANAVAANLKVYTAPAFFNKNQSVTNNMVLTFAERPNSRQMYYELYTSRNNANFLYNGKSNDFTDRANLSTAILRHTSTLVVSGNNLDAVNYTSDDLRNGYNLCLLIDETAGTSEYISFESIAYNSSTAKYTLSNVKRGLLDTIPKAFSTNAKVYFFSDGYALNSEVFFDDNESIRLKAKTFTSNSELSLDSAPVITYTVTNRSKLPINVANLKVNTVLFEDTQTITGQLNLTWALRNKQANVQFYSDSQATNSDGNTTEIRIYNINGTLLKSVSLTGNETSYSFTDEMSIGLGGMMGTLLNTNNYYKYLRVVVYTTKSSLESLERYSIIIQRT